MCVHYRSPSDPPHQCSSTPDLGAPGRATRRQRRGRPGMRRGRQGIRRSRQGIRRSPSGRTGLGAGPGLCVSRGPAAARSRCTTPPRAPGVVHLLLAVGADPDARDSAGLTPLHPRRPPRGTPRSWRLFSPEPRRDAPGTRIDSTPLHSGGVPRAGRGRGVAPGAPRDTAGDRNRIRSALEVAQGGATGIPREALRKGLQEEGLLL